MIGGGLGLPAMRIKRLILFELQSASQVGKPQPAEVMGKGCKKRRLKGLLERWVGFYFSFDLE